MHVHNDDIGPLIGLTESCQHVIGHQGLTRTMLGLVGAILTIVQQLWGHILWSAAPHMDNDQSFACMLAVARLSYF